MKDIENESIWVRKNPKGFGKARNTIKVLGTTVDEDGDGLVWIEWGEEKEYETFSSLYFLDTFEEKKPFFGVGKTYRLAGDEYAGIRWSVTDVVDVDGKPFAVAVRTSKGVRDLVVLNNFILFREV